MRMESSLPSHLGPDGGCPGMPDRGACPQLHRDRAMGRESPWLKLCLGRLIGEGL